MKKAKRNVQGGIATMFAAGAIGGSGSAVGSYQSGVGLIGIGNMASAGRGLVGKKKKRR